MQQIGWEDPSQDWEDRAACRGEDLSLFFAPHYFEAYAVKRARESGAKAICRRCPVQHECRAYALETRVDHGVWGGLNESERRRVLRARDRAEAEVSAQRAADEVNSAAG